MGNAARGEDPYLSHWADHAAARTIAAHPNADTITVAAGITPSGVVHVGNFREVITVDLVARALGERGVKTRFIYSWDDFDVFRKVPADMPKQELLAENLGRSIADVPDPYGEHESYAAHHVAAFERSIEPLGIDCEFIRQHARYRSGSYANGIQRALRHKDTIRQILNRARTEHGARSLLADDWLPISAFCGQCGRDEVDLAWDGEWKVSYRCRLCEHEASVDLREGGDVKLPWRVDWPMRWDREKVCFEPGGKDHSSAGGSYDTAKRIVADVYGWRAPQYVGYDFVSIKGRGGKISSSSGGVVTVADCLEIYEPQVLRWLFASYRPNTEFQISFDLDVIKIYEDYDRAVRLAREAEDGGRKDRKRRVARRTLELASIPYGRIEPGSAPPRQPGFRHLSIVLQIFDGDLEAARGHYEAAGELETEQERGLFTTRARCVWTWIEKYAPDDFCYRIREQPVTRELDADQRTVLGRLVSFLEQEPAPDEPQLAAHLKTLCEGTSLDLKKLSPLLYDLLIARDHGPRLSTLLFAMGPARALPLLRGHGE